MQPLAVGALCSANPKATDNHTPENHKHTSDSEAQSSTIITLERTTIIPSLRVRDDKRFREESTNPIGSIASIACRRGTEGRTSQESNGKTFEKCFREEKLGGIATNCKCFK